jgi:hypothetical protein
MTPLFVLFAILYQVVFLYMLVSPAWFIIVGSLLLQVAGERTRRHPLCGRCGYDLAGSLESSSICSECGGAFAVTGIVPIHEPRQITPWAIGAGLLIIGVVFILMLSAVLFGSF